MVNGAALLLTRAESDAYCASRQPVGVPESWEDGAVARRLKDGTAVKNVSGADLRVYVMAGGMAVPLAVADFTGLGYDQQPLRAVPGTWEAAAAARTAPRTAPCSARPTAPRSGRSPPAAGRPPPRARATPPTWSPSRPRSPRSPTVTG
ncbi:hypothetical protein ACWEO1_10790 [Kitasatospora cineracea]